MRLKHIKLAGFKSFVDVTKVPFPHQMTAIVGPNGCGKSNIIDAVRWVLGESSAKNLRGDAMSDVIFNGSTNRKPVGQASVELLFDNSQQNDHNAFHLVGELAKRTEISVKRALQRDGTNHYFLNGSRCRRKDITDVFLGTGLGPRSYAIIEQGMISRLIESKPQELRVFVEEAAGVSKYKERRRETELKIKQTKENLARLQDISQEIAVHINVLSKQAAEAQHYKSLKAQERSLKTQVALLGLHTNEQHIANIKAELKDLGNFQVEQRQLLIEAKANNSNLDVRLEDAFKEQESAQQTLFSKQQTLNELKQTHTFTLQRHKKLQEKLNHIAQQEDTVDARLNELVLNAEKHQSTLKEQQLLLNKLNDELTLMQANYKGTATALDEKQRALAELQQRFAEQQKRDKARLKIESEHIAKQASLEAKVSQLNDVLSKTEAELAELSEQEIHNTDSAQQTLTQNENELQGLLQKRHALLNELKAQRDQIRHQELKLAKREVQLESLNNQLVESTPWQQNVAPWVEKNKQIIKGKLLDYIEVEPDWQDAVISYLGAWLDAFVVESVADNIPEQPFWMIDYTRIQRQDVQKVNQQTLASVCHSSIGLPEWFQYVQLAENTEQAVEMRKAAASHITILTRDGTEFLGASICKKGREQTTNVLATKSKLEADTAEFGLLVNELTKAKEKEEILVAKQASLDSDIERLHVHIDSLGRQINLAESESEQRQQKQHKLQTEIAHIFSSVQDANAQLAELAVASGHLSSGGVGSGGVNADIDDDATLLERLERYQLEVSQLQQSAQKKQSDLNDKRFEAQQVHSQLNHIQMSVHQTQLQIQHEEEKQLELLKQRNEYSHELGALADASKFEKDIAKLGSETASLNFTILSIKDEVSEVKSAKQVNQTYTDQLEQDLQDMSANMQALTIKLEQYRFEASSLQKELDELEGTGITPMLIEHTNKGVSHFKKQLKVTQKELQALGLVNLAAIDEFQVQEARKNQIDLQIEDLSQALATLESAIEKIDKESRKQFKATFDRINHDFSTLFPKVFGGGSAYLSLTDNDLLETGVSIMAQPPGKKNSTIHLLSGGEKALTALSLVFAIFRLTPAPFCMLDEVDAPLDDANVERFCNLVQEMSKTVQFIYISHNKIAMEMASHLTGVTMREPGVSRLVSVDIDEAITMAEVS
ncbi:chromosome segregation protein SMC [Thalassotalea euphylliae]|uniref:chromosome segregation protein SMC n=1 Tax=Thalassotalea euphylliae TaxID=1655234 RepID=UPI003638CF12